jgi:hypothetical protein
LRLLNLTSDSAESNTQKENQTNTDLEAGLRRLGKEQSFDGNIQIITRHSPKNKSQRETHGALQGPSPKNKSQRETLSALQGPSPKNKDQLEA